MGTWTGPGPTISRGTTLVKGSVCPGRSFLLSAKPGSHKPHTRSTTPRTGHDLPPPQRGQRKPSGHRMDHFDLNPLISDAVSRHPKVATPIRNGKIVIRFGPQAVSRGSSLDCRSWPSDREGADGEGRKPGGVARWIFQGEYQWVFVERAPAGKEPRANDPVQQNRAREPEQLRL